MRTDYTIYHPNGVREHSEHSFVDWPEDPGYVLIRNFVKPILKGGELEHVTVLHDGKYLDMFVDDMGHSKSLPLNAEATAIYRNNARTRDPSRDPETMPRIVGVAVLFSRRVWF